ncbi:MAG: M48 family metalloprotease [Salinibacterium sp.]|nr:M48 family metalloprotease [Salinibacterium sp.]
MNTFVNNAKTVLLMGAMTGLLVVVGGALGKAFILPFFIMAVVMNVGMWLFSDKLAIASMRGEEVTEGRLYEMVDRLRRNAGLPMPRVFVCPHQAPNAFATGRSPRHAAVAVTQGALQLLSERELEGVMAHELAHVKNRDTLTSTIAATIAGLLAMLAQWGFFLGAGNRENGNPLVMIGVVILSAVGAAMLKAMISRSREFVADADGARIAGTPEGLMYALGKLESLNRRIPLQSPNPAQNSMFIVEPFSGGSMVNRLFASHPPTEDRLAALAQLR